MNEDLDRRMIIQCLSSLEKEDLTELWDEFTPAIIHFDYRNITIYLHRPRGPESSHFLVTLDRFGDRSGYGVVYRISKRELGLPN